MNKKLAITTLAALLAAPLFTAQAKLLDSADTKQLINGAIAKHWYHRGNQWLKFHWYEDGSVHVYRQKAENKGDELFDQGQWYVKAADPKQSDVEYVLCQELDKAFFGHELCFEVTQTTFRAVSDGSSVLDKTQHYEIVREGQVETGEMVITRR
ncbi:MAG: hypothetical protein KDK91_24145 [Gammaproteobacteria bacterium]|nr:hypothetical protein [Gammaproteobacteria bacterium]